MLIGKGSLNLWFTEKTDSQFPYCSFSRVTGFETMLSTSHRQYTTFFLWSKHIFKTNSDSSCANKCPSSVGFSYVSNSNSFQIGCMFIHNTRFSLVVRVRFPANWKNSWLEV